jgi:DNA-binding NarL/FixJ family response regulator
VKSGRCEPGIRATSPCLGAPSPVELSPRELAVASSVVAGLALKTIASQLDISVQATSTYLTRARRKFGQPSRWKMVALLRGPFRALRELASDRAGELTPAELDLGELLLRGLSNAEIAQAANISNKLAGRRMSRLFRKLQIATRTDLFDLAGHRGESTHGV